MIEYVIYCDGSSTGKIGDGGWGYLILDIERDDDGNIIHESQIDQGSGNALKTTNQRMEQTAAIMSLRAIYKFIYNDEGELLEDNEYKITIMSDSQYVIKGITEWIKGWIKNNWMTYLKKPVANKDLWVDLKTETERFSPIPNWEWVKGHSGVEHNETVDQLAKDARLALS